MCQNRCQAENKRQDQRDIVYVAENGVRRGQEKKPEGMRESLNALGDVPAQAVTIGPVVDRSKSNVCIIADPGTIQDTGAENDRAQGRGDDVPDIAIRMMAYERQGSGLLLNSKLAVLIRRQQFI